MTVLEKTKKFSSLIKIFSQITSDWLYSNSDVIIDEMRLMWDKGEASNGKMPDYKNLVYRLKKNEMGSQSGIYYDLKLHGDFRDGMFATKIKDGVKIYSKDEKANKLTKLTKKQGALIWKLNKEHQKNFIDSSKSDLINTIRKQLA